MPVLEKKKIPRIVTFDIMRGFFLIAIIINHINFFPNYLDWWGLRGQLLVSTAEGFFLLSGIVLGIVRGAKLVDLPFNKVSKIVLDRALKLYLTYIVLVIAFTAIGWYLFPGNPNIKYGIMPDQSWLRLIGETITLQYTYGWADYLRFYALFIAVSPLALWLLRRGQWYVVLLASFAVWFISPIDINTMAWESIQLYQPIPWQLLFFTGLVIGYHWPDMTAWYQKHQKAVNRYIAIPLVTIAILTLCWNIFTVFAQEFVMNEWTKYISHYAWELRMHEFHKEQLPFVRFGLFMLWFWAAFIIVQRFEKPIVKYTGWLLLPIGTNALYVYTMHAVVIFFVHIYFTSTIPILNFFVTAGVIAIIYLAVRTKFLFNVIPR